MTAVRCTKKQTEEFLLRSDTTLTCNLPSIVDQALVNCLLCFVGGQRHYLERGPLLQCGSSRCRLGGGACFQSGYQRAEGDRDHTLVLL